MYSVRETTFGSSLSGGSKNWGFEKSGFHCNIDHHKTLYKVLIQKACNFHYTYNYYLPEDPDFASFNHNCRPHCTFNRLTVEMNEPRVSRSIASWVIPTSFPGSQHSNPRWRLMCEVHKRTRLFYRSLLDLETCHRL